jgi:hypothetical protein
MNHRSKMEGTEDSDGSGSDIDLDADESMFKMSREQSGAEKALAILEAEKEEKRMKRMEKGGNNPNRQKEKLLKISDMKLEEPPKELSRKEREAIEAQKAEAAYRKKHAAGETDEAKTDLKRLAAVKKAREEQAAKKKAAAEKEEAEAAAAAKAKADAEEKAAKKKKGKKGKKDDSDSDSDGESRCRFIHSLLASLHAMLHDTLLLIARRWTA